MQIFGKNLTEIVINYRKFTQILGNFWNFIKTCEKIWESFAKIMIKVNEIAKNFRKLKKKKILIKFLKLGSKLEDNLK